MHTGRTTFFISERLTRCEVASGVFLEWLLCPVSTGAGSLWREVGWKPLQILHTSRLLQILFMCPHFRHPRQSAFAFIKSLLSATDFFRNCLHTSKSWDAFTSKSWDALHSGHEVASDFLSFLLLVLLSVTSWDSVARALNLGGFLLLKSFDFRPLSESSLTTSSF